MIRKNRARSSSLFLMELILAILFFSITSAVCIQFFVKSHLLSQDSQILTHAVNECSAAAEMCSTSDSSAAALGTLVKLYPDADKDLLKNSVTVYYTEDFKPCKAESGIYSLNVILSENDTMLNAAISFTDEKDKKSVYNLNTSHHIAKRAGNE